MNQPWIYMCSPSWSPLPPPSPSHPSGSSQCTSPEHLSHASNLGWWSVSHLIIYMFQCYSLRSSHPDFWSPWSAFSWINSSLASKSFAQWSNLLFWGESSIPTRILWHLALCPTIQLNSDVTWSHHRPYSLKGTTLLPFQTPAASLRYPNLLVPLLGWLQIWDSLMAQWVKNDYSARDRECRFNLWVGKIPQRR